MEAARNAVGSFLNRGGEHHTDVDERVNPAVTEETIKPHRHEETTEAVDREVHQDHFHTTVQPLAHKEVLPEQHQHNLAPQVERSFHHGDVEQDRSRVASELGQFQNTSTTHQTTQSTQAAPSVTGEHTHHHVHEIVQPVIHKETIQPEVVHTTIPIHEKHHAPSEHHGLSVLPTKTLDELKSSGTSLSGGPSGHHEYEGHPRSYNHDLQVELEPVDRDPRAHDGTHDLQKTGHLSHGNTSSGVGSGIGSGTHSGIGSGVGSGIGSGDHSGVGHGVSSGVGSGIGSGTHSGIGSGVGSGVGSGFGSGAPRDNITGSTGTSGIAPGHEHTTTGHSHSHGHEHGHGTSSAMGAGVAGVAAGTAASDLGRDHTRAHNVSDLNPRDTSTTFGDSGSNTTGTALGGRFDNSNLDGSRSSDFDPRGTRNNYAPDAHLKNEPTNLSHSGPTTHEHGHEHHHKSHHESNLSSTEHHGSTREGGHLTGGDHDNHHTHTKSHDAPADDGLQHASRQGQDPSLVKDSGREGKLTGSGVDGSHSAVFGLTPDGHKFDDTSKNVGSGDPVPAEGSRNNDAVGGGKVGGDSGDIGSSGVSGQNVAQQLHDPKVAEKGHDGQASYGTADDTKKPGAGL